MLDLLRSVGLVDRDGHQPGVRDADVGDLPLRPVRGPERDSVLRVQPLGQQGVGHPTHGAAVIGPTDRRPALARLEMEGGRVTPALRGALEQRGHGFGQLAGHFRRRRRTYGRAHAATIRELRRLLYAFGELLRILMEQRWLWAPASSSSSCRKTTASRENAR